MEGGGAVLTYFNMKLVITSNEIQTRDLTNMRGVLHSDLITITIIK